MTNLIFDKIPCKTTREVVKLIKKDQTIKLISYGWTIFEGEAAELEKILDVASDEWEPVIGDYLCLIKPTTDYICINAIDEIDAISLGLIPNDGFVEQISQKNLECFIERKTYNGEIRDVGWINGTIENQRELFMKVTMIRLEWVTKDKQVLLLTVM